MRKRGGRKGCEVKSCHILLPKEDRECPDGFDWTPQCFMSHNGTIVVKLVLYQPHDKTLYEFKYTLGTYSVYRMENGRTLALKNSNWT